MTYTYFVMLANFFLSSMEILSFCLYFITYSLILHNILIFTISVVYIVTLMYILSCVFSFTLKFWKDISYLFKIFFSLISIITQMKYGVGQNIPIIIIILERI